MANILPQFMLTNKIACVTGGAMGIGKTICETLAAAGAKVIVADFNEELGEKTAAEIGGVFLKLDVTKSNDVERAVTQFVENYGAPDIVVNNAGIVHNEATVDLTDDDWHRVIDVNLNGVFYCARAFGRAMLANKKGSMISTSSICGSVSVYPQPQIAYNASKAGVNLLTKSLAVEWAKHGVRVNAVAPGYVETELTMAGRSNNDWYDTWINMTPMGRMGKPQEIANCVLFLASDAASYITGTVLMADGGYTAL